MSNPQAPRAPAQQAQTRLLKADDVPKLQHLNDDMKQKYRPIIQNLWSMMQQHPQGSEEHNSSRKKLHEWSTRLINQEMMYRNRLKTAQQQQQQQQNQGQPSQSNQQPANPTPEEQQQPPKPQPVQQPSNAPQGARPPQANPQPAIDPEILRHVQAFQFALPVDGPQAGTPAGDAKLKQDRNSYVMALNRQQKATQRIKILNNMIQQKEQAGQDIPPEIATQKQSLEKEYNNTKEFIDNFRKRHNENRSAQEQRRAQQGQAQQTQQAQQAQPAAAQQQQRQTSQPNIKEEPQVKVEGGQPSQGPAAQQFVTMHTQPNAQAPPPIMTQQQPPQQQQQSQPQPQAMRQPPMPHLQQNQPQPQFAQPGPPQGHQQPQRPPINPHQANSMPQVHPQNNSPHPQSATSNPGGPPAPLSHQAAVSAAQRSYSNQEAQRTNTPIQGGAQGNFHTPGSREREQLNNPKMPIPRTLQTAPPTPVGMGQARPTMSGPTNGAPGPMGQPVISKFPPFQLEGENDRVLSKRKLDELVRQVTGGSEEALTPEVEEAVLQLADDFVDTVIGNACKLSKLRESSQLDVRDIQLVIERNYNIRIPGYSSDEVRTVRRLVPAPGWTQKMNAVQAAKVMGGKNDI
ncbi:hypothetical protein DM02DRAFT_614302 [Periconia macrospinosa]|uniref:Transcription initiation factor TFIID subunit 12 domain-containing protein n=1 Tax=Periconia macrospinosa TaxID=97972 RepID=A0A2V1DUK6_9PLEO|nr:hypothetical protein DM02DRAFT_614302 [Periconia macrospinosa]